MSSVGSFGTFTTARLGIYASQKGLSVTGNNIANINTTGYTRQRLDQASFKSGGADRYQSQMDVRVGNGVLCIGVSQLRDPYLDIRFRTENSSVGFYDAKLSGLKEIQDILDEVGKGENKGDGLLYAQFSDFFKSLEELNTDAGAESNDLLARASADSLVTLFHSAADSLETLRTNTENQLRQKLNGVNNILSSIRDLNAAIRKSEIHGDPALELRDDRNLLIDELSEYMKIDVTYSEEDIGSGYTVEKLTIRLGNGNPDSDVKSDTAYLVDGIYAAQLTTPKANPDYDPDYTPVDETDTNIAQYKYLDENGAGTNDPLDAMPEFDDDYNVTLSQLLDSHGREWVDYNKPVSVKLKDTDGFPTKAEYSVDLSVSGTWKDGDTISLGGQTLLTVGADISAESANSPAKLAKAIAKRVSAEGYTTSATAAKNQDGTATIHLTLSADESGAKGDQPDLGTFTFSATPFTGGSITPGTLTDATPESGSPLTYTLQLGTDTNWGEGDQITINGVPVLTVGEDLSVKSAGNPERLAAFIARKMNVAGYTVTADGDSLVFTANSDASNPLAQAPALAVTPPTSAGLTQDADNWTDGADAAEGVGQPKTDFRDNGDGTISKIDTRYAQRGDDWYEITTTTRTSRVITLDDNDLCGSLQAVRELLTEEGEFASPADIENDEEAAIKRGIPFYQHSLDLLARQFAKTFNEANNGYAVDQNGNYLTKGGATLDLAGSPVNKTSGLTTAQKQALIDDGCVVTDEAGDPVLDKDGEQIPDLERWLQAKEGDGDDAIDKLGGNLFSQRGDTDDDSDITASNISVSQSWANGSTHIVTTFTKLFGGEITNTTQGDNVRHMLTLMEKALVYNPQDLIDDAGSTHLFEGSFQEMFSQMSTVLGNDKRSTTTSLNTHYNSGLELDTSRDSVSAVDLNDEAMNLMQYTHSLNAAYRLMTTIDEALERLITGTGVTR